MRFSVWAPRAVRVDLVLPTAEEISAGERKAARAVPMVAGEGGQWSVEVPDAGHGTDYAFALDGGTPLPDPRSAWQPHGVHGPSRVFDASRHVWQSDTSVDVLGRVLYELHVGTYTPEGTLDAAVAHLDELVDLGVDVVQLMPLAAFDGVHGWGYDGVALHAVHEPYGGPAALQRFVDACHARGLGVALDVVYNHLGPSGNYLAPFGPYFTEHHHTPWGAAVNLDDTGSAEVRRWILENALRWLTDFRIDALRLDAVHALVDDSPRHLLAELSDAVAARSAALGRPLRLIAESDLNDPIMIEPTSTGGRGMDAQWADDVHHAVHALVTRETDGYYVDFGSVEVLARTLTGVFHHDGGHSTFRDRAWGRPVRPGTHPGHAFLAYTQTHDQVGNRALGDRLAHLTAPGRAAAAAALVLTSPFTPMLFMGEEWGASTPWQFFTSFDDDLGALVRAGRRAEFSRHGWDAADVPDPQDRATRDRSVLDRSERTAPDHARMLAWYRALLHLRRAEPDLRDDDLTRVHVTLGPGADAVGHGWIVVHRGRFDVLVNLTGGTAELPCRTGSAPVLSWFASDARDVHHPDGRLSLPGDGAVVVRRS